MEQTNHGGKNNQINANTIGQIGDTYTGRIEIRYALPATATDTPPKVGSNTVYRAKPVAQLNQWHEQKQPLMGIVASSGFGKSVITATVFQHWKTASTYQKALWIQLKEPTPFSGIAAWILQEINFLVPPEFTSSQLREELRRRLCATPCLLVLDQLETVQASNHWQEYEDFLQHWVEHGSNSTLLLTSQQQASLPGTWLPLGGLTIAEAQELLATQLDATEQIADLVTLTQGHPLLLNLAANWVTHAKGEFARLTASDLDFFRGLFGNYAGNPQAQVGEIFAVVFGQLPPHLQTMLQRVSVYRQAFGLAAAQAMVPENPITEADLHTLTQQGFLLTTTEGNWTLHSLVQHLVQDALKQTGGTQTAHELAIAYFANNRIPKKQTLEDCRAELEECHHRCELSQYHPAYQVIDSCDDFLDRRGYWQERLLVYERLTRKWQANSSPSGEEQQDLAWALTRLGNNYKSLGFVQQAIGVHTQSHQLFLNMKYRYGEAASLNNLGDAHRSLGNYQQAINFLQQSLSIAREIGNRRGEAASFGNLGTAYNLLGNYQQSIYCFQQSLAMQQEIGDRHGEATSLNNLGNVHRSLEDYQQAIDFLQRSLAIAQEIGDRSREVHALGNLGATYNSLEDYQQAIAFLQQSLAIAQEIGDRDGESACLNNLGTAYKYLGDYQQAIGSLQQSVAIAQEIDNRDGEGMSLFNLGVAFGEVDDPWKAKQHFEQALAVYEDLKLDYMIEKCKAAIRKFNQIIAAERRVAPSIGPAPVSKTSDDWWEKSLPTAPTRSSQRQSTPLWVYFLIGLAIVLLIWWLTA
ncbi:tetratricopeptide repeat protein [Leptolyngbya sp. AN02str]|uniref:tetratricopeptide repeat protein n=1 Tax=Leptolyngbya sp. AN02str TaxID=3423363 RepID=UPI003D30FA92